MAVSNYLINGLPDGGGLSAPTLAGINSITSATGSTLTLATLDANQNIILSPHGTGVTAAGTNGITFGGTAKVYNNGGGTLAFSNAGGVLNFGGTLLYPNTDNAMGLGASTVRFASGFFGPTGLRVGNGTSGPTITASDDTSAADFVITNSTTGKLKMGSASGFTANNTVATVLGSVGPTGANPTVQEWFTVKNSAGTVRYIPAF